MLCFFIYSYIPHRAVTFDDRDNPWINKNMKYLIWGKNEIHKIYVKEKHRTQNI